MKSKILVIFSLVLAPIFCNAAIAEDIYKSVDASGVTHYSSKPKEAGAAPVKLPPITRGESKIPASQLVSCKTHGGIDCQVGTDQDGSVICNDGFRDSAERFSFSCSAPKLEISNISEVDLDGNFTVHLRNSRSVVAKKPQVLFRQSDNSKVKLNGPNDIEPFGVGEFVYNPPELAKGGKAKDKFSFTTQPRLDQLDISCENCS